MQLKDNRRSDRISVELPIQVSGSDTMGREFFEEGRTDVIDRHGAKILVARKLAPQQELTIKCLENGREAAVRVVGQIEEGPGGHGYGVMLIDPHVDLWGIKFPPRGESEDAVGRVVLECLACHTREVAYLGEFELEVLEASQRLSRQCKLCADLTVWKKSFSEAPPGPESAPVRPLEWSEKRREPRRELRVTACVRSRKLGEDIVMTHDVSRGGVCFESSRRYAAGLEVEVAIPYAKGGGNIFVAGRIAYVKESEASKSFICGLEYREPKS